MAGLKIIILGKQGSGKGTQAALISKELGIAHMSTGEIFRKNIKEGTELGRKAQDFISKGELVPGPLVNELVRESIKDLSGGFILDGYPRTLEQAEELDRFANIDLAIEVLISDQEAVKRISSRRTCESCGAVTSSLADGYTGACSECGGRLVQREDDNEAAVRRRLEIYRKDTEPIVSFYRERGILLEIPGQRPIRIIFGDILDRIRSRSRPAGQIS